MKNNLLLLLTGILLLSFTACQDLVEINLAKKNIVVLAPSDNTVSPNYIQTFWWEEVKGANSYNLQIVKPSFNSIQQLNLDTTITTTQFSHSLLPGIYQWRVRALNGSSNTEYAVYNLTIDSTLDLSNQWVILTSPGDNDSSSTASHTFSWQTLNNTDSYLFQVIISGLPIHTQTLTNTNASYTFTDDGTYQWRVLAQNGNSTSSPVTSTRNITIDRTAPGTPQLLSPYANDTASNPVNLTWTRDASATKDSVYVYADTNLTTLVTSELTTSTNFNFNGTTGQDYFWRVRSLDAVGNKSAYSARRKFIVVP